jgi:hypothetical protein
MFFLVLCFLCFYVFKFPIPEAILTDDQLMVNVVNALICELEALDTKSGQWSPTVPIRNPGVLEVRLPALSAPRPRSEFL